jgi:hypothetical protein
MADDPAPDRPTDLDLIHQAVGPAMFNRLVRSAPEVRRRGRLRYWQERLFTTLAVEAGVSVSSMAEFLRLFEGAAERPVPKPSYTLETFLDAISMHPFGTGLDPEDIPAEWMAQAWMIPSVREAHEHELARSVSKVGSLCATDEYLRLLDRSLTVDQLRELFVYIRAHGHRESEFRPEFEQAFPRCVPMLPPAEPELEFDDAPDWARD